MRRARATCLAWLLPAVAACATTSAPTDAPDPEAVALAPPAVQIVEVPPALEPEPEPEPTAGPVATASDPATTTAITFDEIEENPGPTDAVTTTPKRPSMPSMLTPDMLRGPK